MFTQGSYLRHHRPRRDGVQAPSAAVRRGAAELEHPRPEAAYGAQLGDGRELLVGGGEPELDQRRGLVDVDPGGGERAQVVRADRQRVAELLHVGGAEVVHGGPVDDQRPAAEPPRRARGRRATSVVEERASASVSKPPARSSAPTGSTPRLVPGREAGARSASSGERAAAAPSGSRGRRARPARRRAARPRARSARSATVEARRPTCTHSEVTPFSRSVRAASCAALRVGVGERGADVPASPRAGGRHAGRAGPRRAPGCRAG